MFIQSPTQPLTTLCASFGEIISLLLQFCGLRSNKHSKIKSRATLRVEIKTKILPKNWLSLSSAAMSWADLFSIKLSSFPSFVDRRHTSSSSRSDESSIHLMFDLFIQAKLGFAARCNQIWVTNYSNGLEKRERFNSTDNRLNTNFPFIFNFVFSCLIFYFPYHVIWNYVYFNRFSVLKSEGVCGRGRMGFREWVNIKRLLKSARVKSYYRWGLMIKRFVKRGLFA